MSAALHEHRFEDAEQLARELGADLVRTLSAAVESRGRATLAVSGGSTPLPLFRALRSAALPWSSITVMLVDERWVDRDHADSNAAFVHRELLTGPAAAAGFLDLKNDAPTPEQGEPACEAALADVAWPLDAVVLGMGGDGHTASLFPRTDDNADALALGLDPETGRRCVAVRPGEAPHPRMSLTLAALTDAERVILHITGDSKWQVYQRALGQGPQEELPIRAVLRQTRRPVEVYWAP